MGWGRSDLVGAEHAVAVQIAARGQLDAAGRAVRPRRLGLERNQAAVRPVTAGDNETQGEKAPTHYTHDRSLQKAASLGRADRVVNAGQCTFSTKISLVAALTAATR
jgi:hypothetical protein